MACARLVLAAFGSEVALSRRYRELKMVLTKVDLPCPLLPGCCCLEVLCLARDGLGTPVLVRNSHPLSCCSHPGPQGWVGYWGRLLVLLEEVDPSVREVAWLCVMEVHAVYVEVAIEARDSAAFQSAVVASMLIPQGHAFVDC